MTFLTDQDRECLTKGRYSSLTDAEREGATIFMAGGPNLRVYQCSWCSGFHLTSSPPRC